MNKYTQLAKLITNMYKKITYEEALNLAYHPDLWEEDIFEEVPYNENSHIDLYTNEPEILEQIIDSIIEDDEIDEIKRQYSRGYI